MSTERGRKYSAPSHIPFETFRVGFESVRDYSGLTKNGGLTFFGSSEMGRAEYRARQILRQLGQDIEGFRSIHRLSIRFGQPRGDLLVLIFLIPDQDILNNLLSMRDRIFDLPVVLSLPDSRRETLLKGHKFYPRFVLFNGESSSLAQVLQNIIHREVMLLHNTLASSISEGLRLG